MCCLHQQSACPSLSEVSLPARLLRTERHLHCLLDWMRHLHQQHYLLSMRGLGHQQPEWIMQLPSWILLHCQPHQVLHSMPSVLRFLHLCHRRNCLQDQLQPRQWSLRLPSRKVHQHQRTVRHLHHWLPQLQQLDQLQCLQCSSPAPGKHLPLTMRPRILPIWLHLHEMLHWMRCLQHCQRLHLLPGWTTRLQRVLLRQLPSRLSRQPQHLHLRRLQLSLRHLH